MPGPAPGPSGPGLPPSAHPHGGPPAPAFPGGPLIYPDGVLYALDPIGRTPNAAGWDYDPRGNPTYTPPAGQPAPPSIPQPPGMVPPGPPVTPQRFDPRQGPGGGLGEASLPVAGDPWTDTLSGDPWTDTLAGDPWTDTASGGPVSVGEGKDQVDRFGEGKDQVDRISAMPEPTAFSHVPTSAELDALPPGAQATTPWGPVERGPDGKHHVVMDDAGKAAFGQAMATARANFGVLPFAALPGLPMPPVEVGKPNYNPWMDKWS